MMTLFHATNLTINFYYDDHLMMSFLVKQIFLLQFHLDEGLDHGVLHVLFDSVQELLKV